MLGIVEIRECMGVTVPPLIARDLVYLLVGALKLVCKSGISEPLYMLMLFSRCFDSGEEP